MERKGSAAYAAEFIGTLVLVLFICLVLATGSGLGVTDWAVIGLVHAFVLAMLAASLGGVSGGHFNPAVTVALFARRKIAANDAGAYIVLQLLGGIAGAFAAKALMLDEGEGVKYGATLSSEAFLQGDALPAMFAEAIGTFALMWAIMGTAVNPKGSGVAAPLYIGGALGMAVMVIGPLTGAGFNPARSFGPALAAGEWAGFWAYVVGPAIGALLAATVYSAIALREDPPEVKLGAS